jgi:hypothetical protein
MPFPSDNISRFPTSARFNPMTPAPALTEAELAASRAAYLDRLAKALPNARKGLEEETARIIAEGRARRGRLTLDACREDEFRLATKRAAE